LNEGHMTFKYRTSPHCVVEMWDQYFTKNHIGTRFWCEISA